MTRQRPLVQRRFGVRASPPDAMNRQFALVRGFRGLERRRVTIGALLGVAVVSLIAVVVASARPGPLPTLGAFLVAGALFAVITFMVAAVFRPARVRRALELYRWVSRADALRWRRVSGEPVPRTPARARSWLETHPAAGGADDVPRVELLVWVGELDTARRVAHDLPSAAAWDRYIRALQLAFVDFVATGDGDLSDVRAAAAVLDDPDDARRAAASIAVEDARQRASSGQDFLDPLARARDALGDELDGFLLPDLARWVAWPLLAVGLISSVVTFAVAVLFAAR